MHVFIRLLAAAPDHSADDRTSHREHGHVGPSWYHELHSSLPRLKIADITNFRQLLLRCIKTKIGERTQRREQRWYPPWNIRLTR